MGGQRRGDTVGALGAFGAPLDVGEWGACYCCGRSYLTTNMVRFHRHPDDALCVGCVSWLHDCSRPIIRKLYPIWQLPAFVRAWLPQSSPPLVEQQAGTRQGRPPSFPPPQAGRAVPAKPRG
jgi:hypothetical protein